MFEIVVAQPILSRDARHSWFFVSDGARPLDLFAMVGVLCFLIPATFVGIECVIEWISPRLRRVFHAVVMAILLFLFIFEVVTRFLQLTPLLLLGMWLAATVLVLLYQRLISLQQFVTYLSIAILVIPGNFLLRTPMAKIALPGHQPAAAQVDVGTPVPVVMLVFDEFPLVSLLNGDNQIDSSLYPNFASFSQHAYWFRDTTTVSDYTYQAVPAILTGRFPDPASLPVMRDHPDNLFTLLGNDYDEQVIEPITRLCPEEICHETSLSWTDRLNLLATNLFGAPVPNVVTSPDRLDSFPGFLNSIKATSKPTLYFDHVVVPHEPWRRLPDGKLYTLDSEIEGLRANGVWSDDDWQVTQSYQRHLLQAEYVDSMLGQAIDRLKAAGIYDKALIVVVADHGATFDTDEERRTFDPSEAANIMPVPLLIKVPHQTSGVVSDQNAQTIDVLPTIADVLGVDLPWKVDGRSLLDPTTPAPAGKKLISANSGKTYEFGSRIEGIDAAIQHKESMFGDDPDPDDLYRIGPYRSIYGAREEELDESSVSPLTVELDHPEAFIDVDLDSSFVPALIEGRIVGDPPTSDDVYLAISVNGTFQAVTRTFSAGGKTCFFAIVPESALHNGDNAIDVFVVSGPEANPHLSQLVHHS